MKLGQAQLERGADAVGIAVVGQWRAPALDGFA